MKNSTRNFLTRAALLVAVVGAFFVGYVADHSAPPKANPSVSRGHVYGEGFADSKAEDCDMGLQSACDWFQDAPSEAVAQFNDGFTEAQADNCQQGFQPACEWISRR
ncbi:hypothetical protein ACFRMQ_11415 [Kitasatospora sp. NPDC056783]|uniref:hypothetical protein n=1 Tax=Kitasatospora sp. NPDC056783 TaxID=3345943 RepID=UPI0036A8B721